MGIRQEAKQQSRQKIIDAMRFLLQEKAACDINIEDITTQAGIGKGSFYTHFKRKEDVISAIALDEYNAAMENALNLNGNTYERICEYLKRSAEIIEDYTLQTAQNWMKSVTAPLVGEHGGTDKFHFDYENILRLLTGGAMRGELDKNAPTKMLAEIIMNAYYGAVAVWCITSGDVDLVDSIGHFCEYGLKTILKQYTEEKQ